ncbi:uncharacterized protein LOC128181777 [Crassostrea angulata]|uniref:uncharacterized protein LOC128181777 n=1 Tax=Magallana angulata TaxID=2784310 RepID=UPI0022B18E2D|nr:uncharacterized protein LOC128181777 [Crassostrea angulata]
MEDQKMKLQTLVVVSLVLFSFFEPTKSSTTTETTQETTTSEATTGNNMTTTDQTETTTSGNNMTTSDQTETPTTTGYTTTTADQSETTTTTGIVMSTIGQTETSTTGNVMTTTGQTETTTSGNNMTTTDQTETTTSGNNMTTTDQTETTTTTGYTMTTGNGTETTKENNMTTTDQTTIVYTSTTAGLSETTTPVHTMSTADQTETTTTRVARITTGQTETTQEYTTTTAGQTDTTTSAMSSTSDATTAMLTTTTSNAGITSQGTMSSSASTDVLSTTTNTQTPTSVSTGTSATTMNETSTAGDNQTTISTTSTDPGTSFSSSYQSTTSPTTTSSYQSTTSPVSTVITTSSDTSTTAETVTVTNSTAASSGLTSTSDSTTSTVPDSTTTDPMFNDTTSSASMTSSQSPETTSSVGIPSNVSVSPEVVAVLGMSDDGSRHEPHMVCVFPEPGSNLYFLIKWFINDSPLTTTSYGAVLHPSINTTAALRPQHWSSNYSLNMNVKCSVSAQYLVDSGPSPASTSPPFLAGVTVSNTFLSIDEGESTAITLTSSLPVGCSASLTDAQKEAQCKADLHIITSEWSWCWNGVKYLGVAFPDNGCHVTIPYKYWDQPVYLNVTGYVDSMKNWWGRYSRIKFKSTTNPTDTSNAWNNVKVTDTVSVSVWDNTPYSSTGGICGGFNDPHMVTFDRRYWENQRVGEFVMYQHKTKPLAVHALYSTCYPWRAACNCGVAIRSGKNLYVVRTCIEVSLQRVSLLSYPYERYDGCSQEDEITVQKMGTNYRVTLPSGTEVSFSFNSWSHWIDYIQIVASSTDLQNTEGICGYYDYDRSNDFIPKNENTPISDEKRFALSWRVTIGSSDSLFKKKPDVIYGSSSGGSSPQSLQRYCTCSSYFQYYDQWYNVPFDPNYAKCNLDAPTEPCSEKSGQTVNVCSSSSRRRRSTAESDDVIDEIEFSVDPAFDESIELNVTDWVAPWSEENATRFCNESFTQDIAVSTCIEKVNTSVSEYIASCVEDIKMIGNADFVTATLDTLKKECVTTASRDSSFSNTTSNGGENILDLLKSLVCPNNCSGNGVCANETCSCNTNYMGEDCSKELSQPPTNFTIPQTGACDTSARACQKTNLYGVFHSETIYAKCSYFKGTPSGKENSTYSVLADVQYRHVNLITVTIPSPPSSRRRKRSASGEVHGWEIQLSYDNQTYGDSAVILLFDSTKTSCDTTTLVCVSKVTAAESEPADNTGVIVGGVVGGVVALAVIVGIIIYIKMYKRVKGRVGSSENVRNKDSDPLTSSSP